METRVVDKANAAGLIARRQPGSGVYAEFPSDVVIEHLSTERVDKDEVTYLTDFLVECKVRASETEAKTIRFEYAWLEQVRKQASKNQNSFGIVVAQAKSAHKQVVMMDYDDFLQLIKGT